MITIQDFLETIEYKINDGFEYQWSCFGPNARGLSYENNKISDDNITICCVFDTLDQTVYEMQAWDGPNQREYRWIHPDYVKAYKKEAKSRDVKWRQSYDDNKFIDLEVEEDMLEKAAAIYAGTDYDERVQIELNISSADEHLLMQMAHERDMSFNKFVETILRDFIIERGGVI